MRLRLLRLNTCSPKRFCDRIRVEHPGKPVIVGGVHVSSCAEPVEPFDAKIQGPGELALMQILREGVIQGYTYNVPVDDLNSLPLPAYELIEPSRYHHTIEGQKAIGVMVTRGCPYSCVFCSKSTHGRKVLRIDIKRIEDLLVKVYFYGWTALNFHDDNLMLDKNYLKELCEMLSKYRFIWRCWARTDHVTLDALKMMKAAGCREIGFGIESGSQLILTA